MTPRDQIADSSQARFAGANNAGRVALVALPDIPLVGPGDDLAAIIVAAAARAGETLIDGDILVVAQKIVSKSEDCYADLTAVTPSPGRPEKIRAWWSLFFPNLPPSSVIALASSSPSTGWVS